jgi:hypothetical protein
MIEDSIFEAEIAILETAIWVSMRIQKFLMSAYDERSAGAVRAVPLLRATAPTGPVGIISVVVTIMVRHTGIHEGGGPKLPWLLCLP